MLLKPSTSQHRPLMPRLDVQVGIQLAIVAVPCTSHAANVENKAARRNGLSENPSVSTAALESGASRARYAAMGLDRGEATETFGNEPSTLISVLTTTRPV